MATDASNDVNMNSLFRFHSGERMSRQSDASVAFLQTLDRVMLVKYTEVDPIQGAAIKEIQRGRAPHPTDPGV